MRKVTLDVALFVAACALLIFAIGYAFDGQTKQPACVKGDAPQTYLCVRGAYVVQP